MNSQERNKLKTNKPVGNNPIGFRELEPDEMILPTDYCYYFCKEWRLRKYTLHHNEPYRKGWHDKTVRRIDLT